MAGSPHPNAAAQGGTPSASAWEAAYLRFESPEAEIRKFVGRLRKVGAERWRPDAQIVELFSGRGNGLRALERLGFRNIEGMDLSPRLVSEYSGPARCHVGDCRALPFPGQTKDVAIVQGGLHHLLKLPDDLDRVLSEMRRVLRPSGLAVLIEPWLTPFLRFVHKMCEIPFARACSNKVDALATMIQHERETYDQWLAQPELISQLARRYFDPQHESRSLGKWTFVGGPRESIRP